ncbi:nitroreductase [Candidatus Roizmanbacteria bacterium]|nr:nitroreductase [Candidatus Roizmanbacteria bacterium]
MISTFDKILKIHRPRPRHPVIDQISKRWSPRLYSDKTIPGNDIDTIFEAARWTPSGHNRQPWYFYLAKKNTGAYQKLFSTLDPYNQSWSKTAPVLILACAIISDQDGDNPYAFYDLGASVISLILQAQELGYFSRQMALFDKQKVRALLRLRDDIVPYIIVAMGKIGNYDTAPKQIIDYELNPRPRKTDLFKEMKTL